MEFVNEIIKFDPVAALEFSFKTYLKFKFFLKTSCSDHIDPIYYRKRASVSFPMPAV
jgi:hypothetical protein